MNILSAIFRLFAFILHYPYVILLKPFVDKVVHKLTLKIFTDTIVFNCAWEDPAIDKQALDIVPDQDSILIITSAGCNVLSLALDSPKHIYSIDKNPCQNAVLELKIAAIRELEYEQFWELFGKGRLRSFSTLWYPRLRQHLSMDARKFWDTHSHYFDGNNIFGRNSYYYRGSAGVLAWVFAKVLCRLIPGLKDGLNELMHAETVAEQKRIYHTKVEKKLFNPVVMWLFSSNSTLALLNGVPAAQQKLLEETKGGAMQFIKDSLEVVMTELPMKSNYFWRVYLEDGEYTRDCCPDYLVEENFAKLKAGLLDRISVHTETIEEFLLKHKERDITRYILLDHMDWMSQDPKSLGAEWEQILEHGSEEKAVRWLWRSASPTADFVCATPVRYKGRNTTVGDLVKFNVDLAERLHKMDRVHTYTSFWIADPK